MWQIVGQVLVGAVLAGLLALPPSSAAEPATSVQTSSGTKRFWVTDTHRYTSPWYGGAHRKMIGYGCTRAPYYDPDPRCAHDRGFHHGLDIAMPCGTRLFAGFRGWVVAPSSAGSLGPAYGSQAFRIRNHRRDVDVVIGHARRVYVEPGDRVRKGQLIAHASDAGAPDGCHLHFEVRLLGGGYQDALRPHEFLSLSR